jgi:hypothetical protein
MQIKTKTDSKSTDTAFQQTGFPEASNIPTLALASVPGFICVYQR